jgi:hypothetical protein
MIGFITVLLAAAVLLALACVLVALRRVKRP